MLTFNFSPFPVLETRRLILRRITADDAPVVLLMRSDPKMMRYIPRPLIKTIDEAMVHINLIDSRIITNEGINWAITLKGNDEMVGIIGHYKLEPENHRSEIGYMVQRKFHGQNIVSEAIDSILQYGFDVMDLHSVEAIIDPGNSASAKALEKNNFVKEAHLRENELYDGKFWDTVIYSLLRKNYKKPL